MPVLPISPVVCGALALPLCRPSTAVAAFLRDMAVLFGLILVFCPHKEWRLASSFGFINFGFGSDLLSIRLTQIVQPTLRIHLQSRAGKTTGFLFVITINSEPANQPRFFAGTVRASIDKLERFCTLFYTIFGR